MVVLIAVVGLVFSAACDDEEMVSPDSPGAEAQGEEEPVIEGGARPHFPEIAEEAEERAAEARAQEEAEAADEEVADEEAEAGDDAEQEEESEEAAEEDGE